MIDIVTINKDYKDGLLQTILSVISQTVFDQINYIVIDGGSTDGSKEIIKKYKNLLGYSVSKKDKGIYNAMNKALSHLKGDYVLFLNSGDYLVNETVIEEVLKYLDGTPIIYGDQYWEGYKKRVSLGGSVSIMVHSNEPVRTFVKFPDKIDKNFFNGGSLPHQATFIRVDYHKEHPYDENYKAVSDGIFFQEAIFKNKMDYKHIPVTVSCFNLHGISSSKIGWKEQTEFFKDKDK